MRSTLRHHKCLALALLASIALFCGCAPYRQGMEPVLLRLEQGDVPGALKRLERNPKEQDALYLLERGLLERLAAHPRESNECFDAAAAIAEDLYTRSVSREAAALGLTDRIRPYRPPPHELLLARYYQALNYIEQGDLEGALVEARRISSILAEARGDGSGELEGIAPLGHLLAGIIHDGAGDWDDALIHYRWLVVGGEAGEPPLLTGPPESLRKRVAEIATRVGVDLEGLTAAPPKRRSDPDRWAIVFFEEGFVPPREEVRLRVPILEGESDRGIGEIGGRVSDRALAIQGARWNPPRAAQISYWLEVALPAYPEENGPFGPPIWSIGGPGDGGPLVVANVAEAARSSLRSEMGGIALRSTVRALGKYLAHRKMKEEAGEIAGVLTNLLGVATEAAETRTWLTLPRSISFQLVAISQESDSLALQWRGSGRGRRVASLPLVPIGSHWAVGSFRTW